ncbi:MAG: hypothetical protein DKT66_19150 [Candidatus Melainabacteria bacterium]|nr:MAG: hypothetical protein DKT66_19150 [Candidatus Melainabacteria bacterium]
MNLKVSILTLIVALVTLCTTAVQAQGFGNYQRSQFSPQNNMQARSGQARGNQTRARVIAQAQAHAQYQASFPSDWRNGLPPTRMDSFVKEAKQHAAHIYGDEGTYGLPPYMGFSKVHRINTGIMDERDSGLTTGHGSYLPDAWGGDEFHQNEWTQSGERGRSAADGFPDGLPVMTGSGSGAPGSGAQNLPPPPGEGYQPAYTCEGFVGYYSPEEIALAQTDFPAAFDHFVHSDRYTGSILNADLILRLQMGRPGY